MLVHSATLGFVEGDVEEDVLSRCRLGADRLVAETPGIEAVQAGAGAGCSDFRQRPATGLRAGAINALAFGLPERRCWLIHREAGDASPKIVEAMA